MYDFFFIYTLRSGLYRQQPENAVSVLFLDTDVYALLLLFHF